MPGRWEQVEINNKLADVFEPSDLGNTSPPYGLLFLHGHEQVTLANDSAFTAELDCHGWPAVCPHGSRSWWLDQTCPDFDEFQTPIAYLRESVIPYFGKRWGLKPPCIGLAGIEMGGQGALQVAYRSPRDFPTVAAISPAIDFHNWYGHGLALDDMFANREAARQQTATLQLHPMNWPRNQLLLSDPLDSDWFEGAERLASKLYSSGIPFESDFESTTQGDHGRYLSSMAKPVMEFFKRHREE